MADKEKKANIFAVIGKKMVKFFMELKSELKKVVWPDRKKLTQSTITVVMICIFAAVLIFSVDRVLSGFLGLVGFFPESQSSTVATSNLLPTAAVQSQTSSVVSSQSVSAASSVASSSAVSSEAASSAS